MPVPLRHKKAMAALFSAAQTPPKKPRTDPSQPSKPTPKTPTMASAALFPKFPLLPLEIHQKIWAFAMQPRLLPLTHTNIHSLDDRTRRLSFFSRTPHPTTLSINHESRSETMRYYVLVDSGCGTKFYFNEWKDTIVLSKPDTFWVEIVRAIDRELAKESDESMNANGRKHKMVVRSLAVLDRVITSRFWEMYPRRDEGTCELKELFVVGESIFGLRNPLTAMKLYPFDGEVNREQGVLNHYIQPSVSEGLENMRKYFVGGRLPGVVGVEKGFWKREGVNMVGWYDRHPQKEEEEEENVC